MSSSEFIKWLSDIPLLRHVELRRHNGDGDLLLHALGDASGSTYATVIFARVESEAGVTVTLLSAKSRIAPKRSTIPCLEQLMIAAITARLASTTALSLRRPILKTVLWLDSTTTLAWIKRDMQWGTLIESEWWPGPSWLHSPEAEWPEIKREVDETTVSSLQQRMFDNAINDKLSSFKTMVSGNGLRVLTLT